MAFRFSLQPVLRLRSSYERLEYLRLLALTALGARVRTEMGALDGESKVARARMRERLTAGMSGADLHFDRVCENVRGARKLVLVTQLADLSRRQEMQRLAYEAAHRKREILENLRIRQLTSYQTEQTRREQQSLDELFLLRRRARERE